jgi:hypothetical protein
MAVEWTKAPQIILELAERIIEQYHPHLKDARIAFIMRSEAPITNGSVTYGKCKKVSPESQLFMDFDYVIWLALDRWITLSPKQKEALVDHELSHCQWDGLTAKLKGHDVEEFAHIIERYGFWWPQSDQFEAAVQAALPIEKEPRHGGVGTIDFGRIAQEAGERLRAEGFDVEVTHKPATSRGL